MELMRRSLKAYVVAICIFAAFTLIQAALLQLTSYDEGWSFYGLLAALGITTLLLGIMEGCLVGKRGLLAGGLAAVIFIFIVLAAAGGIFTGGIERESIDVKYLLPVLTGAVGGVLGTNSSKS